MWPFCFFELSNDQKNRLLKMGVLGLFSLILDLSRLFKAFSDIFGQFSSPILALFPTSIQLKNLQDTKKQ